jgi:hypothetical protein
MGIVLCITCQIAWALLDTLEAVRVLESRQSRISSNYCGMLLANPPGSYLKFQGSQQIHCHVTLRFLALKTPGGSGLMDQKYSNGLFTSDFHNVKSSYQLDLELSLS